jgi:hypothetical protein
MERLQLILLLFISSSWLLTCGEETDSTKTGTAFTMQPETDSTGFIGNSDNNDFYSEWLSLPFAGSGTNWMATMPLNTMPEGLLENARLSVFMKKFGSEFRLNFAAEDSSVQYGIDHGAITISSTFNPEGIEFSYRISPDGTFVSKKPADVNYTVALK